MIFNRNNRNRNKRGFRFLKILLILCLCTVVLIPNTFATVSSSSAQSKSQVQNTSAKASPTKSRETVTVMLTGDIMCQPMQQKTAFNGKSYNFKPTFQYVRPIFKQAYIVIGNLETLISKSSPLSKNQARLKGKPYLNSPKSFLKALKYAGFDGFATANNHACDGGETGIRETIKQLDGMGFKHTGTFTSKKSKRYFTIKKNGITIGILSYGNYYNLKEDTLSSSKQKYMLNKITTQKSLNKDVKALKKAGAEYIIAYNHCGDEYSHVPAKRQKRYAKMLAQAGVNYIIGSHPHVLQPYGKVKYNGKSYPVIYSMGNFVSSMKKSSTKEAIILSLTLSRTKSGKVVLKKQKYYPCIMLKKYKGKSYVLMPESEKYNGDFDSSKYRKRFNHIRKIVGKLSR